MNEYIITFGPDHAEFFGFPDYRSYAVIVADDIEEARRVALERLGRKWCNLLRAEDADLSRFPGGRVWHSEHGWEV